MASYQKVILMGRVGLVDKKEKFTRLRIAVDKYNSDEPTWFGVSVFRKQKEFVDSYINKGDMVIVDGEIETRTHEGKEYWGVIARNVQSVPTGNKKESVKEKAVLPDDELPF